VDTIAVLTEIEAALTGQLRLAGDNAAAAEAGATLLAALQPALARAAFRLAEQAAHEVEAQLPDHEVNVILDDGEPAIRIRPVEADVRFSSDDLEARLTLRLPKGLKSELEEAAGTAGDSINAYVIKALSTAGRTGRRTGRRITGTFQT
jgi:hypothetical protein